MALVAEWRRQAARATAISVLGPAVLFAGAAGVASSGGLGALGQVAGGPALPDLGLAPAEVAAQRSVADADIVGADPSSPQSATPSAPGVPGGRLASGPGGAGGAESLGSTPSGPVSTAPLPPAATPPSAGSAPNTGPGATGGGQEPAADPVGDVIETVRGVGESLPGPLGPTSGDILNLLLPPSKP